MAAADVTEEEAILHLKQRLGELEPGDGVPRPLPAVAPKPKPKPPPKPALPKPAAPAPDAQAGFGGKGMGLLNAAIAGKGMPPPVQDQPKMPDAAVAANAALAGLAGLRSGANANFKEFGPAPTPAPTLQAMPPPMEQRPQPPQQQAPPAASAPPALEPGKTQINFDIKQEKVSMVLGNREYTLNAIKTYSKAHLYIEQHTPEPQKARVTVVGEKAEVSKCKQVVKSLCDGTLSEAALFQLAGIPMPSAGGDSSGSRPSMSHSHAPAMAPQMSMPTQNSSVVSAATVVPGMPEEPQMQRNLNDYYMRMWSMMHQGEQPGATAQAPPAAAPPAAAPQKHPQPAPVGEAFDKDMLARLAERAANMPDEPELPPPPPEEEIRYQAAATQPAPLAAPQSMPGPWPMASTPGFQPMHQQQQPSGDLAERASNEVRVLLGMQPRPQQAPERPPVNDAGQVLRGFTIQTKPQTTQPQAAQKDADSVQKMLGRLQENASVTKKATAFMNEAQMRQGQQQQPGQPFSLEAAGLAMRQDTRSHGDYEFEALVGRVQSALRSQSNELEHVGREVIIKFSSLAPMQVAELLQKMDSATGLRHGDFLAEVIRLLIPRLKEFTSTQFTSLASACASWAADLRGDKKRVSRFSEFSRAFFNAAANEMTSRLMEFAPHEINACLAAFVSVGYNERKFFASVGRAALARHSSFAPVQLTALLAILSEMRLVRVDLFNAAAQFLSTRAAELRPVDVMRVLRSFSKCNVQHDGLCRSLGDEVVHRLQSKGSSGASGFKVEELCEISWAFCVLQHYHENMFRHTFRELEKVPMVSVEALCQLYECHLVLDSEYREAYSRYRPDSHKIDALFDHYKESRKDERRCSERLRNDVASALKSLVDGSVHVNHRTSTGLLVDVAALRKRSSTDGFVHVDLDSNVTVVRSLDQEDGSPASVIVEGAVALKRRILQKHGLKLVTIRESDWRELDTGAGKQEKRRHLRTMLSALGDILE